MNSIETVRPLSTTVADDVVHGVLKRMFSLVERPLTTIVPDDGDALNPEGTPTVNWYVPFGSPNTMSGREELTAVPLRVTDQVVWLPSPFSLKITG